MIIEDCNFVPFYIDPKSIIMVRLAGMQGADSLQELSQKERLATTIFCMDFVLMFGITQQIYLSKSQYDKLWERLKNE